MLTQSWLIPRELFIKDLKRIPNLRKRFSGYNSNHPKFKKKKKKTEKATAYSQLNTALGHCDFQWDGSKVLCDCSRMWPPRAILPPHAQAPTHSWQSQPRRCICALSLLPIRLWESHTREIHLSPSSPPCQPDTYSSCSHDLNRLMHALAPLPASLLRTSTCCYLSTWFQFPSQMQPICVIAILLSSLKCTEVG